MIVSASAPARVGDRLTGSVLTVTASENRSQRRNRAAARERLAHVLRSALTPPAPRRATKPTRASKLRRLADKKRRAEVKVRRRRPRRGVSPSDEVVARYAHALPSVRQPMNTQVTGKR